MVVVDTSVWVGFLRGSGGPQEERFKSLLRGLAPVAITDVVFMELLQGVRSDRGAADLERRLMDFPILRLDRLDDFKLAANLHRMARRAGVAVKSKLDFLIAAACIRAEAPLLHADADFDRLASCTALRVFE